MTVPDNTSSDMRQDYPDLNIEIRSILLARCQDGATISDIKEDYQKITGRKFPVQHNITDFLLTIPSVTAYCNERGIPIFNVLPTGQTKHIFDMVQQQKTHQQQYQLRQNSTCALFEKRPRLSGEAQMYPFPHTRFNQGPDASHTGNFDHLNYHCMDFNNFSVDVSPELSSQPQQKLSLQTPQLPIVLINGQSNSVFDSGTEDIKNSKIYEDNCNYLLSRFCNQTSIQPLMKSHNTEDCCNRTNYAIMKANRSIQNYNSRQQNSFYRSYCNKQRPSYQYNIKNETQTTASSCSRSQSDWTYTSDCDYDAHLLDFLLLGDDFLLYLARMELNCCINKVENVLQSGLCVSGQTIKGAIKRINNWEYCNKSVIVNIGSVDIMKGKSLVHIEHDFRQLIDAMLRKGLYPIVTTLAPLANYAHDFQMKNKLERFNRFLKSAIPNVIDIWSCLVNKRGQILFDCFQSGPRQVTGAKEPYVFWNKIGRQRVLQLIEYHLEY